jgi:hypothetical protein
VALQLLVRAILVVLAHGFLVITTMLAVVVVVLAQLAEMQVLHKGVLAVLD